MIRPMGKRNTQPTKEDIMTNITTLLNKGRDGMVPVRQSANAVAHAFSAMREEMDRLFQRYFGTYDLTWPNMWEAMPDMPAADIIENEKSYTVKIDMPGMDAQNVEVHAADGYITVKGERREEKEDKSSSYLRREISQGSFQRSFALPEVADCPAAEASFKNGTLTITVPKKAEALKAPKKIEIKKSA